MTASHEGDYCPALSWVGREDGKADEYKPFLGRVVKWEDVWEDDLVS